MQLRIITYSTLKCQTCIGHLRLIRIFRSSVRLFGDRVCSFRVCSFRDGVEFISVWRANCCDFKEWKLPFCQADDVDTPCCAKTVQFRGPSCSCRKSRQEGFNSMDASFTRSEQSFPYFRRKHWRIVAKSTSKQTTYSTTHESLFKVEEFYVITWDGKKEQIFEMPTGGAAIMRKGTCFGVESVLGIVVGC